MTYLHANNLKRECAMLVSGIMTYYTSNITAVDTDTNKCDKISREEAINQLSIMLKEMQEQISCNEGSDTERYETVLNKLSHLISAIAVHEGKSEANLFGSLRENHAMGLKYYSETDKVKEIIAQHVFKIKDKEKSRNSRLGCSRYVFRLHTAQTAMQKMNAINNTPNSQVSKKIHTISTVGELISIMQTAEAYKQKTAPFLRAMRLGKEITDLMDASKIVCDDSRENWLAETCGNYQYVKQLALLKVDLMKGALKQGLFQGSHAAKSHNSLENKDGEELVTELMGFQKDTYVYCGKIQRKIDGLWRTLTRHFCVIPHNDQGDITEQNIREMELSTVYTMHSNTGNFEKYTKYMAQLFRTILDPKTDQDSLCKVIRKFEYHFHHLSYFEKGNEEAVVLLEAIRNTICPEYKHKGYFEALTTPHFSAYKTISKI